MRKRLLLGYFGVTLFVLLSLEVPLGIQNQRSERADLETKVAHDATVLAADAEDIVQAPTATRLQALAAIAYGYQRRTGGPSSSGARTSSLPEPTAAAALSSPRSGRVTKRDSQIPTIAAPIRTMLPISPRISQ